MTARDRKHYAGSLMGRVEAFYRDNPNEWLTWEDMATKFECTPKQAKAAVSNLRLLSQNMSLEVVGVVRVKAIP